MFVPLAHIGLHIGFGFIYNRKAGILNAHTIAMFLKSADVAFSLLSMLMFAVFGSNSDSD